MPLAQAAQGERILGVALDPDDAPLVNLGLHGAPPETHFAVGGNLMHAAAGVTARARGRAGGRHRSTGGRFHPIAAVDCDSFSLRQSKCDCLN